MAETPLKAPDSANWVHGCFTVKVGDQFKTYLDVLKYAQQDEIFGNDGKPALDPNVKKTLDGVAKDDQGNDATLPKYFSLRKCRDTSLGGNDAINPLPQFNIDDDISHPLYYATLNGEVGMGQVYSENYDDTQQILYLGFGVPLFNDLATFWTSGTDFQFAKFVNTGSGWTAEKIGYLLGSIPVRIISIATIPLRWIDAWTDNLQQVKISKYYTFQSQMPMYFRYVNTILVLLATNMHIVGSEASTNATGSQTSGTTPIELEGQAKNGNDDLSGLSSVFRNFGLDMAKIVTKRYFYEKGNRNDPIFERSTDGALEKYSKLDDGSETFQDGSSTTSTNPTDGTDGGVPNVDSTPKGVWTKKWFDAFAAAYETAIYDGHLFIGLRIERGTGASESFTNSTGESKISQAVNAKFDEGLDARTSTGNFGSGGLSGLGILGDVISGVVDAAKGVVTGLTSAFSMDPLGAVVTGTARVDIPEVWTSSTFSRSSSFTINCMSPYGDFESIFQSEYVPLACILAGVLPRATGTSSHSSPFVCQAYCRGVFSSPLCIIESVSVTRGADQFGFSAARLPLELSIQLNLKDLYPVMAMSMGGGSLINGYSIGGAAVGAIAGGGVAGAAAGAVAGNIAKEIFQEDDPFSEYMMTLSGMGLRDRLSPYRNMRKKAQILLTTIFRNRLSPYMLGMEGGSSLRVSRVISAFASSGSNLPSN